MDGFSSGGKLSLLPHNLPKKTAKRQRKCQWKAEQMQNVQQIIAPEVFKLSLSSLNERVLKSDLKCLKFKGFAK